MSMLGETVKYKCSVLLTTAHGFEAPDEEEFDRILSMALKDALNTATTPYYVISTAVWEKTGDIE